MRDLLEWTRARTYGEAALLSFVVNVILFVAMLGLGELVGRMFRARPVVVDVPPLSRDEVRLATVTVILNSVVMLSGWSLFHASILDVEASGSPLRWCVDAIVLLAVMDFAMYVTHRAAHLPRLYRFHAVHHRYDQPRTLTLFVLHPIEVLGFGGLWITVLCLHGFSLGGMLLYLTVNSVFGTIGHVGVEPMPTPFARWPLLGMLGTSTFHARHHQRPHTNFGFYTAVWDRLFGTLDPRYVTSFAEPWSSTDDRPPRT